jgi:hypothetical protein
MDILSKLSRFWQITLPTLLLATTFHYAHHLNTIINSIGGVGFKRTITIIFLSFLAIWSLFYLSSIFFVRVLKWIWFGTVTAESEKKSILINKEPEQQTKSSIEYHDVKEQENLFRLDLQDEPAEPVREEGQQENKVL